MSITVKEICEKAGFNRSTFYLHYDTINDLLNATLNHMISKLQSYFSKETGDFISKIDISSREDLVLINREYLKEYLNFVKDNKKVFIVAFKNHTTMKSHVQYSGLEQYILTPILNKYNIPDYKRKYMLQFFIHGIMAIVKEWTLNDCQDDIDTIIDIIIECVRP